MGTLTLAEKREGNTLSAPYISKPLSTVYGCLDFKINYSYTNTNQKYLQYKEVAKIFMMWNYILHDGYTHANAPWKFCY